MRQQQQRPPKMIVRRDGSIDWKGSWLEGHRYYDHRHRHHHHHHRRRRRRRREERGGTMMGMSSLVGMMMIGGGGGGRGKKKGNGRKGGDDDDVPFFVEYRPDLTADEDEEEGRVVGREGGDDDDDDDDYDDDDDDGINGKRRMTERLSSAIRGAAWKGWKNKGGKGVRDDYIDIDGADDRRSPSRSLVLLAPPPPHNPPRSSSSRPPPPPSSSCSPHPHRNLGALIFGDDAVSNNRAGAGEMMYTVRAAAAPPRLFRLLFRCCIPHIVSLHGRSRSRRRRRRRRRRRASLPLLYVSHFLPRVMSFCLFSPPSKYIIQSTTSFA